MAGDRNDPIELMVKNEYLPAFLRVPSSPTHAIISRVLPSFYLVFFRCRTEGATDRFVPEGASTSRATLADPLHDRLNFTEFRPNRFSEVHATYGVLPGLSLLFAVVVVVFPRVVDQCAPRWIHWSAASVAVDVEVGGWK